MPAQTNQVAVIVQKNVVAKRLDATLEKVCEKDPAKQSPKKDPVALVDNLNMLYDHV